MGDSRKYVEWFPEQLQLRIWQIQGFVKGGAYLSSIDI